MKLLPALAASRAGSSWPAAVEQERRDRLNFAVVEALRAPERSLHHVKHAHHDGGEAGPLDTLSRAVNLAAVLANPAEPACAGVALGDRVRGDEAESAVLANQVERAAKEMGHEIGIATRFGVKGFEPIAVSVAERGADSLPAQERWIPRRWRRSLDSLDRTPPGTRSPSGTARAAVRLAADSSSQPRYRSASPFTTALTCSLRFPSRSFGFSPSKKAATTRSPKSRTLPSSDCASSQRSRSSLSDMLSSASRMRLRSSVDLCSCSAPESLESRLRIGRFGIPVECLDLLARESDQRIAVP